MDGPSKLAQSLRAAGLLVVLLAPAARAAEPLDLVPADCLLAWYGRPVPDLPPPGDQPSTLQTLLELGSRLMGSAAGATDPRTQLWVRSAELFNLVVRYPHAVALLDIGAKPVERDPVVKRLAHLSLAVIVQDGGQAEPFLRVIQKAVNEQTDAAAATLEQKHYKDWSYQVLHDRRLPDWCTIAWGRAGEHFVFTIGKGVWPCIAAVAAGEMPAISQEPWFAAARRNWGLRALIEVFAAVREMRSRLDPLVDGRASAFFEAWDARDLEQAHWAVGLEQRALFCIAHYRVGGDTVRRHYADAGVRDPRWLAVVPPDADYAVFDLPLDRFLRRFFRGLLTTQMGKPRANVERIWADLQARHGFDVERNLLAHLGEHAVLHNFPPHPLRVPLAVTYLLEIRGDAAAVRATLDAMCSAFQREIDQAAEEGRGPPPWNFRQDPDGVWYVRYGVVAGPAWKVTPRFIVLSWSPHALREYLEKMQTVLEHTAP